jgi:L-rhamnonate dehydratase
LRPIGRKGLGMAAISAVDLGLWDAYAQHLGVPVYDLLGGRNRPSIPVYASRLYGSDDLEALAAEAKGYLAAGFTAMKQRFVYGPADGLAGMRRNAELVRTVREAIGDEADLMADAYMGWDLDYALRMVRLLEPYNLRWLEEPLVPDDISGYAALRARAPMPIAGGEHEATLRGLHEMITARAVDVIQFDTNRVGGLTQARKICALAEAAGLPVIPHAGQLHNYHLVASQPACPMAEYFPPGPVDVGNELPHLLFAGEPTAEAGAITLAETPGLGLRLAPRPPLEEVSR